MHANICKSICVYTYIYIYVYIHARIYLHTYTHTYVPLYNTNKPGQHLTVLKAIYVSESTLASWWNCSGW